jgi:hypothetical protein
MAEIGLSVLSRHCLNQRIGEQAELEPQVQPCLLDNRDLHQQRRDQKGVTVDWRFTTEDARIKLKHLHPSIEP